MKQNKKGVSTVLVSVCLIVITVVASLIGYYYFAVLTKPPSPEVDFYGTGQIKVTAQNWADKTDVSETSPTYTAYNTLGTDLDSMVKADFAGGTSLTADTATDINILPEDEGYLALWIYPGTAHFIDLDLTQNANNRIKEFRTDLDINADGKRDTLASFYVGDLGSPGQAVKPSVGLNLQLVPDETADLTINSPADKVMGTGTKTGTVEWQIGAFEEKKGWTLARVYVTQNRTDEDVIKVTGISVGYDIGAFTEGSITYETGAKRWSFDIDVANYRAVQDGRLIERPVAGTSYCSFTLSIETYFAGGGSGAEHITLTLYVEEISPAGTITTDSDFVYVADA